MHDSVFFFLIPTRALSWALFKYVQFGKNVSISQKIEAFNLPESNPRLHNNKEECIFPWIEMLQYFQVMGFQSAFSSQ